MVDISPLDEQAVAKFDYKHFVILMPRGQYGVVFHSSFLRLQGKVNDFKIQYDNISRIIIVPKSNQHTFLVVYLESPIRKGKTSYPNIVLEFETDYVVKTFLCWYADRLSFQGPLHEAFASLLDIFCDHDIKFTRTGIFRSCQNEFAVKSSVNAEDGLLYPIEDGFVFLPKPTTIIFYIEIEYIQLERHGSVGHTNKMKYFDLLAKLNSGKEFLFRNIQSNEYQNLLNYISDMDLKIVILGAASSKRRKL